MANLVSDGGGKTYTSRVVLKSNTTYQNYIFTSGGGFTTSTGITNVLIQNNKWNNATGIGIDINTWADKPASSSNVEVANNTVVGFSGGSQYFFSLSGVTGFKVHHNSFTQGSSASTDNGVIYIRFSSGDIYNNYANNFRGKAFRVWPITNGAVSIYNNIVINTSAYSGIELNGGYSGKWTVSIYNNTLGNFTKANNTPTGGVTLYDLDKNGGSHYSFTDNIVFNTSAGLLDNESGTNGVPTDQTGSVYYKTMQLAGFANDAAVRLPDGTNWNNSIPVPPVNQNPVANAGVDQSIQLPVNQVILDGSASSDPDGTIAEYDWTQLSGPSTASLTPTNGGIYCSAHNLVAGIYTFQLSVTDDKSATAIDNVNVVVNQSKKIVQVDITYTYDDGSIVSTTQS